MGVTLRDSRGRFATTGGAALSVLSGGAAVQTVRGASGGGVVIRDVDHGYKARLTAIYGLGRPSIDVGILEADGAQLKKHRESNKTREEGRTHFSDVLEGVFGAAPREPVDYDSVTTLIEVAVWNEFGTATIPERSFIRAWFDEALPQIKALLRGLTKAVVAGERTKEQIVELLAVWCVGQIQSRMANGVPPPNAPSTIRRKGSSTPLIDIGQLRSAISFRVR